MLQDVVLTNCMIYEIASLNTASESVTLRQSLQIMLDDQLAIMFDMVKDIILIFQKILQRGRDCYAVHYP